MYNRPWDILEHQGSCLKLENYEQNMKVWTNGKTQGQHMQKIGWERRTFTQGFEPRFASQSKILGQEMIGTHWMPVEKGLEIQSELLEFHRRNKTCVVRMVL